MARTPRSGKERLRGRGSDGVRGPLPSTHLTLGLDSSTVESPSVVTLDAVLDPPVVVHVVVVEVEGVPGPVSVEALPLPTLGPWTKGGVGPKKGESTDSTLRHLARHRGRGRSGRVVGTEG